MSRIWGAALLAVVIGVVAVLTVVIDTDAQAVLGEAGAASRSLETRDGRVHVVAIRSRTPEIRSAAVVRVTELMRGHPLVADVSQGPSAPSTETLETLWHHRFALAPPGAEAITSVALGEELQAARAALGRLETGPLAEYYLRDPTGSFRELIGQLRAIPRPATDAQGHWLAQDDETNLIFAELADVPFDAGAQEMLDAKVRAAAEPAEVLILGPRSMTVEVSSTIAARSQLFGALATLLLLAWLTLVLRSATAILACLVPLAVGLAAAVLMVSGVFGSIHVIAIGFGATLLGLAMDYPLHVMSHADSHGTRRRAVHLVVVGAVTTTVTFLALLGAGVPVLAQMGTLVATGLVTAAGTTAWIAPELPRITPSVRAVPIKTLVLPSKTVWLVLVGGAIAAGLWATAEARKDPLIALPRAAVETIDTFRALTDLPSARVRIEVTATNLPDLAHRLHALAPVLADLSANGEVARAQTLASAFPEIGATSNLPTRDALAANLPTALESAGFASSFAKDILESYDTAVHNAQPSLTALESLTKQRGIAALIAVSNDQLIAPVSLFGVADADAVVRRINAARLDGVAVRDTRAQIGAVLGEFKDRALVSLGVGIVAGMLALLVLVHRLRQVGSIALACAVATLVAAMISGVVFGGFSIIQIVALALIVGIGIDYGVFTELTRNRGEIDAAARSVTLCAVTTLIAFGTLSFSGVNLLEEIGVTVSAGVMIMLVICLTRAANSPKDST